MKYPEYVYDAATQRLEISKEEVDELPTDNVFEAVVGWELGYSSWADTIKRWVLDTYKVDLVSD